MRHLLSSLVVTWLVAGTVGCEDQQGPGQETEPASTSEDEVQNGAVLKSSTADAMGLVRLRPFEWKEDPLFVKKEKVGGFFGQGLGSCSGLLYNKQWILTAQHCWVNDFRNPERNRESEKFGAYIVGNTSTQRSTKSYEVYLHPTMDFAVVKLPEPDECKKNKELCAGKVVISAADFTHYPSLGFDKINCYGYGSVPLDVGLPTWSSLRVDLTPKASDYRLGTIGIEPNVDNDLWRTSCEGGPSLVGQACATTSAAVPFQCIYPNYYKENAICKTVPYTVKGDSGGPCFSPKSDWAGNLSTKPRLMLAVGKGGVRDDREKATTPSFIAHHTTTGVVWPWLIEVGVLPKPQGAGVTSNTGNLYFPDANHFFGYLSEDDFQDYIAVRAQEIRVALNNGSTINTAKLIPIEPIVPEESFFYDFDRDGLDDLGHLTDNTLGIRSTLKNNTGAIEGFSAESSHDLPSIGQQTWQQAVSFFVPLPNSSHALLARVDANLLTTLPWQEGLGYQSANVKTSIIEACTEPPCEDLSKQVDLADFDKKDDLIDFVSFSKGSIYLKYGLTDGTFGKTTLRSVQDDCTGSVFKTLIDLNGDNLADYVCVDNLGIKVWLAKNGDVLDFNSYPQNYPFAVARDWPNRIELLDVNQDGLLDVAVPFASRMPKFYLPKKIESKGSFPELGEQWVGHVMYKIGDGMGGFGEDVFSTIPQEIMDDTRGTLEAGRLSFLSAIGQLDNIPGFDIFVIGRNNLWTYSKFTPPKIFSIAKSSPFASSKALIPRWKKAFWSHQRKFGVGF